MTYRPQFKSCYDWEVIAPHGVLLLSERAQFLLRGRAYTLLAPFLDGKHTTSEMTALLAGKLSEPEVLYALELLGQKGHLVSGSGELPPAEAAFYESIGASPEAVARRKSEFSVTVRDLRKSPDGGDLPAHLQELGLRVEAEGMFGLVVVDDYLQEELADLNRDEVARGRPWLIVRPAGLEMWLGPIYVPGKTGCHACLSHCLSGHRKAEAYVKERRGLAGPLVLARAALPSTRAVAFGLAATEVAKWMAGAPSPLLEGRVLALDTLSLERTFHVLTRRPQCPVCGDPGVVTRAQEQAVALGPCAATFVHEGGYRRSTPEEMLARYEHHVSPITGIVSHLKRILHKRGSHLTVSYAADHNFAHVDEDLFFLKDGQRSHSGGKGKSDAQAKASALGESIERYSGLFHGDEARIRSSLTSLGDSAIHPNACMLFSERQMQERQRWNQADSRYSRVPEPFDPGAEIEWSPVFPVKGGSPRYLPTAYCYFGYARRHPSPFTFPDSNGCAAGATKEEAVLQGLLELCERDATAVWWYNRIPRPGVDLASFGEPYYAELTAYYRSIQRTFWAIDLTHDLGVPTFAALSRRTDKKAEDIIFGLGSHLDPKIALLRAVTELNQFLPAVLFVTPEGEGYKWSGEGVRFFKTATLESDPYLGPSPSSPLRTLADYPITATADLYDDILQCASSLEKRGIEPLLLDQTRPETGLHVVRVVAPGLRHFWARFAPGRLFDVPVRLGWLSRPHREDQLNPFSIFF